MKKLLLNGRGYCQSPSSVKATYNETGVHNALVHFSAVARRAALFSRHSACHPSKKPQKGFLLRIDDDCPPTRLFTSRNHHIVCTHRRNKDRRASGVISFETFIEVFVAKSEPIELEAVVTLALPNAMFKLKLDNSEREILGIVSGKMRKHFIRILPGDRVKVELSPYDLTKGRIIFRQK